MSKEIVDQIENALKAGIAQKSGVKNIASKIGEAKPMADNAFGFDSRASVLLNKAEMCIQRAYKEIEQATRKMAGAVAHIDEHADLAEESQRNLWDENDEEESPPTKDSGHLQLNGEVSPSIEAHRLVPGGDAHDSLSVPQLASATKDELAVLRGVFEVDGKLYTAITVAPDRHCEAHELIFADEVGVDALEFKTKGGYIGQHALLDYEGDGELDEVILGDRVRFVVPQPEELGDVHEDAESVHEEDDAEHEPVDVVYEEPAESEPATA